jgi:hypothetical protein
MIMLNPYIPNANPAIMLAAMDSMYPKAYASIANEATDMQIPLTAMHECLMQLHL